MRAILFLLVLCGALCRCATAGRHEAKGAQIGLHAIWPSTPLLHEAAEFLADEDQALFWTFAEGWLQGAPASTASSDAVQCWQSINSAASQNLTPGMSKMLPIALASRQYSPRLEVFRQLAASPEPPTDACCWAAVNGLVATDAAGVEAAVLAAVAGSNGTYHAKLALYPFDHVYTGSGAAGSHTNLSDPTKLAAVLYAPLGAACATPLHATLSAAASRHPDLLYAWRPLAARPACAPQLHACGTIGTDAPLALPGYGVEMAIKNMEYNARDDSAGKGNAAGGSAAAPLPAEDGPDEVAGFHFDVLLRRKPALRQELLTFRDHLLAAASQEQVLKVWDLKDLGLQAVQRITAASDPLHLLGEVAQNFPLLVEALSRVGVEPELRRAVTGLGIPATAQFLLINGVVYNTRDFDLYDFLGAVRREVRLADALAAARLPPSAARKALLLRIGGGDGGDAADEPRLDLRPSASQVLWVNDIEKDAVYARMPRALMSLLQPTFPGQMPSVRRNLFTAIYLFDPAHPGALDLAHSVQTMLTQRWPIRFGLMPVVQGHASGPALTDAHKLARIVALVGHVHGGAAALGLVAQTAESKAVQVDATVREEYARAAWVVAQGVFKSRWAAWGEGKHGARGSNPAASAVTPDEALQQAVEGSVTGEVAVQLLSKSLELATQCGVAKIAAADGMLVLNGAVSAGSAGSSWQALTVRAWQNELQATVQSIYTGQLQDESEDLYGVVLAGHTLIPWYNPRVLPLEHRSPRQIRLSGGEDELAARQVPLVGPVLGAEALATLPMLYFGPHADGSPAAAAPTGDDYDDPGSESAHGSDVATITHWVVADASTQAGLQLVIAGLQHSSALARVGVVVNARTPSALTPVEELTVAAAAGLLGDASHADLVDLAAELAQEATPGALTYAQLTRLLPEGLSREGGAAALLAPLKEAVGKAAERHSVLSRRGLHLGAGANAVVTNGRIVEVAGGGDVEAGDFPLLDINARRSQYAGAGLLGVLRAAGLDADPRATADAAAIVSSALATYQPEEVDERSARLAALMEANRRQPQFISVPAESSAQGGADAAAPLLVQAILDPLSKQTQQLSGVLSFVRFALGAELQVLLNPELDYSDLPLKAFYRFVTPASSGSLPPPPPAALFAALPPHKTLTLGMDVPEGWLVQPVVAPYDLDNLRLEELPPGVKSVEASFELEALLVTGMCIDSAALQARSEGVHPRGVQLQLGTAAEPHVVDTLVMSNLGYFQLKAAPAVWSLRLAPGRSQELYGIVSSTGLSSSNGGMASPVPAPPPRNPGAPVAVPVAVTTFSAKDMVLILRKQPDHLLDDVLDVNGTDSKGGGTSLWGGLGGMLKGKGAAATWSALSRAGTGSHGDGDTIHVFTVASGHMYERLQKIMILSALKRTRSHLKFWFIKNYMSPQMKAFVPIMARQYGFDYEFVTYKWPSWLHKQTEKQRIIWAYKILFLDVLFPLGLKKVIFCDSDQVIRADLRELWEYDLGGAPYGYTPFCDTNKDMDGFRFWKQGFWKDHLRGRPYHISALYVIDLERFRQMAAGDRLRIVYDNLSKDPNSLANLDQDLPNYAQQSVPIASLPQEWLWCETWCGEASRKGAKTIDLCNNPLTKEPKLQSARRIIAEWPDLNREAEEFTSRVDAVLAGEITEGEVAADSSRFMTFLEPMVEGSVRTTGGGASEIKSGSVGGVAPSNQPGDQVAADPGSAGGALHDSTEL